MYEKEEQKLNDFKDRLEQVPLPLEAADGAIMQGLERAKREKMQKRVTRKRTIWSLAAAALLILTLATTIRVSPAFANAVASIPGMEKFVELIQNDKGLNAVFENDYYQPIGESQTLGSAMLTIDGVILDESGMNIFYTIESAVEMEDIQVSKPELENQQEVVLGSISYNHPVSEEDSSKIYTDILAYTFTDPVKFESLDFKLELEVDLNGDKIDFSVPFTVPENVKASSIYALNKEVEVEGQKFTIEEVTIHPLRVGVQVSFHPDNTKKILKFEDMRLENGNGEVWGSIINGITSFGEDENGNTLYFLQSNYFETPEELYLRIDKVQAIDKEEAFVLVDTEKNILLNAPEDGNLQLGNSTKSQLEFNLHEYPNKDHFFSLFSKGTDANDKDLSRMQEEVYNDGSKMHWNITLETTDYVNPLKFELVEYPNYINGDVKIELKK